MGRLLSVVLAALVLLTPFLLPVVPGPKLAARAAGELVTAPLAGAPESADERALFDALIAAYGNRVPLGEFEFEVAEADSEATEGLAANARSAFVRALRSTADDRELADFRVVGEQVPVEGGLDARVRFEADALRGRFQGPNALEWSAEQRVRLPGRTSLWPPLVAVAIAILLRRPLLALFLGVLSGSVLLAFERLDGIAALARGALDVVSVFFYRELVDPERALIIGFVVFMLAMVGVLTKSGAIRGLMDAIARRAKTARGTQVATYLMGLAIFFDDYANTILVGSTMRPLTDRFRIAREKLAYLVDSTAAPVAGLSIFSTWIAFEVSTYSAQLPAAGLAPSEGYAVFMRSVPYSFYCIFTLVFVGWIALSGRDFGPMRRAELRASSGGGLLRPGATPMVSEDATSMEPHPAATPKLSNALLALGAFLAVTLLAIAHGGGLFGWRDGAPFFDPALVASVEGITLVLNEGSGSMPLFIGSLAGLLVASVGALGAGLGLRDVGLAGWTTLRSMGVAFGILYLAWMIGAVTVDLDTAGYLTAFVGDTLPPGWLPTGTFLLAGIIAFATGSSWSTMSIVLPLAVPLAYQLGLTTELAPLAEDSGRQLMVITIGSVLSGAIFGDHCSPISDTTVMSSIASASDHIDHVRTQVPYAVAAMSVSVVCGYLPAAHGVSPWICLAAGSIAISAIVLVLGKRTA